MRNFIDILGSTLTESTLEGVVAVDTAIAHLKSSMGDSGGEGTVLPGLRIEVGRDPYDDDDEADKELEEAYDDWCFSALEDAYYTVMGNASDGLITAWRTVTAPPNWTPSKWDHPGIYWSWDKDAAEAHWGGAHDGAVEWMLAAKLPVGNIDWLATLVQNADPSYASEREVRVRPGTHIDVLNYWRV